MNEEISGSQQPPSAAPRSRFVGYAAVVGAGILLSRIAGLVRERVFAHYFGNSDAAGAFRAGLRIPNLLQNLFGEGVLSASFIPVYSRLLAEKKEEIAGRVAGAVASLLALLVSGLVLIGVLLAPWIIDLIVPGFEGEVRALTILIVRILFPGAGLLVMSAWCLGVLNSHRKFFLSYVAPVLWNIAMIATMVIFGARMNQSSLAVALSWGTVAGSALQFLIQVPFVLRYAPDIRLLFDTTLEPVRNIVKNTGPVLVGRGIVQISGYIDQWIASFLGTAAVSVLGYAQTIYFLPISLFGMSVAAAELPQMSSEIGTDEEVASALRRRIEPRLRDVSYFVIPTIAAFLFIGESLVAALYQTGEFGSLDTLYVWYTVVAFAIGLLAVTLGRLYNSAFYALGDPKTPLRFAVVRVGVAASLGALLAFPFRPALGEILSMLHAPLVPLEGKSETIGVLGIALATGFAGWLELTLLRRALVRRIGPISMSAGFQLRVWASAVTAGLAAAAIDRFFVFGFMTRLDSSIVHVVDALVLAATFGAVYLITTLALSVEQTRRIVRKISRR